MQWFFLRLMRLQCTAMYLNAILEICGFFNEYLTYIIISFCTSVSLLEWVLTLYCSNKLFFSINISQSLEQFIQAVHTFTACNRSEQFSRPNTVKNSILLVLNSDYQQTLLENLSKRLRDAWCTLSVFSVLNCTCFSRKKLYIIWNISILCIKYDICGKRQILGKHLEHMSKKHLFSIRPMPNALRLWQTATFFER